MKTLITIFCSLAIVATCLPTDSVVPETTFVVEAPAGGMGGMGAMFHDMIKKVVDNAVCKMQFAEGSCPEAFATAIASVDVPTKLVPVIDCIKAKGTDCLSKAEALVDDQAFMQAMMAKADAFKGALDSLQKGCTGFEAACAQGDGH